MKVLSSSYFAYLYFLAEDSPTSLADLGYLALVGCLVLTRCKLNLKLNPATDSLQSQQYTIRKCIYAVKGVLKCIFPGQPGNLQMRMGNMLEFGSRWELARWGSGNDKKPA